MTDSPIVTAGHKLRAEMVDRARTEWEAQRAEADERLRTRGKPNTVRVWMRLCGAVGKEVPRRQRLSGLLRRRKR